MTQSQCVQLCCSSHIQVSTAVTLKNAVLWDVTPADVSDERIAFYHHEGDQNRRASNNVSSN
jgi:hypothetical protein